ncbi:MAG: HAMP domain-containing protein, partial [Cyanobacteria bacterium NC_groundwater_1444_Ag_S-0.65um_54_12]|nr:HAMP domain-containing protein [Cyanobacteria bacterium NC_groundwater_1444_Ag_S-0.65um_54_12]
MKLPGTSFRLKVTWLFCSAILLLGVLAVHYARHDMRRILSSELERRGIAIAEDLAANAMDPLLVDDQFELHRLVNRVLYHNPDVRYIFMVDAEQKLRVNTFGYRIPRGLFSANVLTAYATHWRMKRIHTEEGLIRDFAVPILDGKAGTVRVGVSDKNLENSVANNTRHLSILVMLATIIGMLGSYYLAGYLTRPLLQLLEVVQSVSRGNLSQQIPGPFTDEVGQLASAFNVMTRALTDKEAVRRALLEKVIHSQEEERKRLARELHDELAQQLTFALFTLEGLEGQLKHANRESQTAFGRARAVMSNVLAETRRLIRDLRPAMLDDLGLVPAIRSYAQTNLVRLGCHFNISANLPASIPPASELTIFRIVQEAINNIAKHAQASNAEVALETSEGLLRGTIIDNGRGFHPELIASPSG